MNTYKRKYPDKRLDKAYRLFVDSRGTIRELAAKTKASERSLARYSKRDEWVAERIDRADAAAKSASDDALRASYEAAKATEAEIQAQITATPNDPRAVILAVLKRQQMFWDRLEQHVREALDDILRKAGETRRPISLGQLIPLLKAATEASAGVRKAYGIPDVSKLEFEDKTPVAMKHAEAIRRKRLARLQATPAAAEKAAVN